MTSDTASRAGSAENGAVQVAKSGLFKRVLLVVILIGVVASAAAVWKATRSTGDIGPKMTYVIRRGDMLVTVTEQGTLESSENTEIKCKVRGQNTVIWVIEGGTVVKPGDVLVRLDTLFIEEQINERSKYALWSRSGSERSKADVARSTLAVSEYKEGRFRAKLMGLEKDLAISESNLTTAKNMLDHAEMMAERGYVSELEVSEKRFGVKQAKLDVEVKKTDIDVLKRFTKKFELESLKGNLAANKARHEADKERAFADGRRRDRAVEEFKHCVVKAPRGGLVIHPSAAKWRNAPEIEEGATVHKDQVMLLMPDLAQMQVKVGIHESIIDRVKAGLEARVTLTDRTLKAKVSSVSEVTRPAGWWTGNLVKYDTVIRLPAKKGLKPGMSAEVEVIMAKYFDEILIPVAAVVETAEGDFCWVKIGKDTEKRSLELGDSNDVFIVVKAGLKEGEEVVLNPIAFIEEAQNDALKPGEQAKSRKKSKSRKKARADKRKGKAKKKAAAKKAAAKKAGGSKKAKATKKSKAPSKSKAYDKTKKRKIAKAP